MPQSDGKKQKDKVKVKNYLKAHGHKTITVDAEPFVDIVESVVKLHNQTIEVYRGSGLG